MNAIIKKITTNYFKTLQILFDNQVINPDGISFVPMTQIEIAKEINVSKITMYNIFKELKEDGLIESYPSKRGMYIVTEYGKHIINTVNNIKEKEEVNETKN